MIEYRPLEYYSNWCELWRLDETEIVDGEVMRIQWPDGHEETVNVKVVKGSNPYNDHGSPTSIPYNEVYIPITIHGAEGFLKYDKNCPIKFKRGQVAKFEEWAKGMKDHAHFSKTVRELSSRKPETMAEFSAFMVVHYQDRTAVAEFLVRLGNAIKTYKPEKVVRK